MITSKTLYRYAVIETKIMRTGMLYHRFIVASHISCHANKCYWQTIAEKSIAYIRRFEHFLIYCGVRIMFLYSRCITFMQGISLIHTYRLTYPVRHSPVLQIPAQSLFFVRYRWWVNRTSQFRSLECIAVFGYCHSMSSVCLSVVLRLWHECIVSK